MIQSVADNIAMAETAFANKQYGVALNICKTVLYEEKLNVDAMIIAGRAYLMLEKLTEAENYFRQAVALDGENGELYFDLGNSQFGQQKISDALKSYAHAIQLGCNEEVSQKIYYIMGLINQVQGEKNAALLNYEKSESIPVMNPDQADIILKRVQIYVESGNLSNAENYATQLKLLVPQEFKSYQLLFQILLQQKKVEQAEFILSEAAQFCSKDNQTQVEIMFDHALLHCFRAEQDPDNMQQHYSVALTYLADLQKTANLSPDITCEIMMTTAEIKLKLGDIDSAMEYSENIAKRVENELLEYIEKARFIMLECHMNKQNYINALQYAKQLKKSDNLYYKHHGYYSEAYATKKFAETVPSMKIKADELYERAIAYYRNCTVTSPNDSIAVVYRIKAYADIAQFDKATELCKILAKEAQKPLMDYINKCRTDSAGGGII